MVPSSKNGPNSQITHSLGVCIYACDEHRAYVPCVHTAWCLKVMTNTRSKGTLTEDSNLNRSVTQTAMTGVLRVLLTLLTHPVGFISTGRIKSHRAAWYDTKAIQTDGTCNCYTGTLSKQMAQQGIAFMESPGIPDMAYSVLLCSSIKMVQGPQTELH